MANEVGQNLLMPASTLLTGAAFWVFAGILIVYALVLLLVSYIAQKRINDVEDFVLAGRRLKVSLATVAMVATWFGAESLMTTTDEVAGQGLRRAMLDPFGVSLCLLLAGWFVAGPLWRMGLMTIPDFFCVRYGKLAEAMSACILVPSYFGWIAAQYLALATLLEQFFGIPGLIGIIGVAALATSYTLLGGMWSVTWTDVIQMFFMVLGLLILGYEIVLALGDGQWMAGWWRLRFNSDPELWKIASGSDAKIKMMSAVSALAIGSLGNLPVQDLMQRICSTDSDRTASRACLLAAIGYFCMGLLPILAGLAASQLLTEVPSEGVLTALAQRLLSPTLLLMFVLAVVSTVLSTVVAAVLAPAAVLSQNLVQPLAKRFGLAKSESARLGLQRMCVVAIVIASVGFAYGGSKAYDLVESSYSLLLVGLFAGFIFGLHWSNVPRVAALASMLVGVGFWLLHVSLGWEYFLQPLSAEYSESKLLQVLAVFPHELGDTLLSVCTFLILWGSIELGKRGMVPGTRSTR